MAWDGKCLKHLMKWKGRALSQTRSYSREPLYACSHAGLVQKGWVNFNTMNGSWSWQGFTGEDDQKQCIFRVQRTVNKLTRTELEVFLVSENGEDSASELKVKGCPFQKSCTIYRGNDIVAQTSLMYKLRQLYAKRNKFRLTIFPGSDDHVLVAALVVIFLD
ncbi:hypothetical protein SO802_018490 [Lithocarpus litseifolius]|uniref:Uncharacterized protein n=1 Tax=Lithocarpus litseifolius TaxID=425828 RepID=A0AAW2CMU7_9ROSI